MNKHLATFLAFIALAVFTADAKTVKIPDADDAVASITFPDEWNVEEVEGGYGADSPDNHVYISAVVVKNETDMNEALDEVFAMLKEHKVELDPETKKEEKFKINDLEAEELLYQGKDEDGPTGVSIVFVPIKDNLLILTYWVTTAEESRYQKTVGNIVNSLKAEK